MPPSRGRAERIFVEGSTHEKLQNACVRLCLNFKNQTDTKYLFFRDLNPISFFFARIPQQRVIINDAHKKEHGKLYSAVWKRKKYVYT